MAEVSRKYEIPRSSLRDHYEGRTTNMTNFIKLAICNMPKVQTSHSKPLKSHLQ